MPNALQPEPIRIRGYYPGVIGRITEAHAVYYHIYWGFDVTFETQVGGELSEFIAHFQPQRDGFWAADFDGRFAGSIAIDGRPASREGARLRWFIVPAELQGRGIGNDLMARCLEFCRRSGHKKIYLWTFAGLEAARKLYTRYGFRLIEEHEARQWGQTIREQKYVLTLANPVSLSIARRRP